MFLLQEFQKELLTVQSDFGIGSDTLLGYLLFFIAGVQVCWKGGELLPLSIQYKISEIHYRSFPGQTAAKLGKLLICCFKSWFIRQWLVLSALLGSVSFFYGSQGCSISMIPVILIQLISFSLFAIQLRNLVWATSKHDVYLMHNFSVMHWSPMTRKGTEVLNLAGPVVPASEVQLISLFSSVFVICLWLFILDSYIQILGIHLQTTIFWETDWWWN